MSRLRTNIITNRMANGAPTVSNGLVISGITTTSEILVGNTIKLDPVAGIVTAPAVDVDDFLDVGGNIKLGNAGVITATSFSGSGANLTSLPAGQLTGTIADARLSTVSSSKLSGALPAIDGSALTGINAGVGTEGSVNTSGIITATAFVSSQGALSNRNKIINGDFTIHQRGGTIASSNGNYSLDRWRMYRAGDSSGGWSVQQSLSSYPQTNISGVIDNFKSSAFITVTSAGSAAANNNCKFQQRIEGSHVYDLAFGTVAAKKVTVSFYVKCSLTGNFGISLVNGGHNRSNVQLYTVNSASTWERKIVTFDGDTSGTWDFTTGTGLQLMFDMGSGSSKHASSTATWLSGEYHGTTSSVKLIHTNGATIQYAGVQLEVGEVASPFEFRNQADELHRCQRYFYKPLTSNTYIYGGRWGNNSTNTAVYYPVQMRDTPTIGGTARRTGGTSYVGKDYFNYQIGQDDNWWENFTATSEL